MSVTIQFSLEIKNKEEALEFIRNLQDKNIRVDLLSAEKNKILIDEYIYEISYENLKEISSKSDYVSMALTLSDKNGRYNIDAFDVGLFIIEYSLDIGIEDHILSSGINESVESFLNDVCAMFKGRRIRFCIGSEEIISGELNEDLLKEIKKVLEEFKR